MSLRDLEPLLAPLAHGELALGHIQATLRALSPEQRVRELAESLLTVPLTHEEAQLRVTEPVDRFNVLQGDIIRTEAAYKFGERLVGNPSYIIATSSCDLIARRRDAALLMPVQPKRRSDYSTVERFNADIAQLTLYGTKRYFYLPKLDDDEDEVLFNVVKLDPLATCSNADVNLAERRASLTLVGWRLFGALVRELLVREADQEAAMRSEGSTAGALKIA